MELFRRETVSTHVLLAAAVLTIQEKTGVCIELRQCLNTWPKKDEWPSAIISVQSVNGQGSGVFSKRKLFENETIAIYNYDQMYTEAEYAALDPDVKSKTRDYSVWATIGIGTAARTMIVVPRLDLHGYSAGYGQYFNRSCKDDDANVVMMQSQYNKQLYMVAKQDLAAGVHLTWNYNAEVPKDFIDATCLCDHHVGLRVKSGQSLQTKEEWDAAQNVLAAAQKAATRAGAETDSDCD
jgi:hypothetical protein